MEECWEQNVDVYHLFIDFQITYDTELRKEIWSEMHKLGFPKILLKLCRILNNEIYAEVKIGKYFFYEFKVNIGLRKGMQLSLCCLI